MPSSSASPPAAAPVLSFASPDEIDVRKQLFGIMLGDQLEATNSVARSKESRKRKRDVVPESALCFQGKVVASDPVLRLALYSDAKTDADIVRLSVSVCDFVRRTSVDIPLYMRDAYAALAKTEDHILQLASIYFFVYWHIVCDPDTDLCTLVSSDDAKAQEMLRELNYANNQSAMLCVYNACSNFEHGVGSATTMMSFVHTMVCDRWKRLAVVPPSGALSSHDRKRRPAPHRKFSSSASASKSKSESADASLESEVSSAHHSPSSSSGASLSSSYSSPDGLRNTSTMSSALQPSP